MSCSFPEVCTAFMLFLTILVTTVSAERLFSILKLTKTYLRSAMGQERQSNLVVLTFKNSIARTLHFEDIIDAFAEQKA